MPPFLRAPGKARGARKRHRISDGRSWGCEAGEGSRVPAPVSAVVAGALVLGDQFLLDVFGKAATFQRGTGGGPPTLLAHGEFSCSIPG